MVGSEEEAVDSEDRRWAEKDLDNFGEFCFETDQLALKGNSDYQTLLKTLVILQGQRMTAVKNMEKLLSLKNEAVKQPLDFVEKLQRGEKLDFPEPQTVAEIPEINWNKYGVNIPSNLLQSAPSTSANNSDSESCNREGERKDGKQLVRGREFNQKKPETFNQLWTPEEQKRLEELLITYPPEQVEMERFRKIARALGNRTPLQVQSRVQKYFIKLQKAGLPVPGRTYNFMHYSNNRKSGHRHQRNNRFLFPSSTFFASATPSVFMNDADDGGDFQNPADMSSPAMPASDSIQVSDEEDLPDSVKNSEDYAELMWLKLLKKVKAKQQGLENPPVHLGFKCDRCNVEPITGTRWHCFQCPSDSSTDFCDSCIYVAASKTGHHQTNHRLTPVIKPDAPMGEQGLSYLQSNFMPDL